jgi:hypothetical protein
VQCGVQRTPSREPPAHCTICRDERQFERDGGQQWTTHDRLLGTHSTVLRRREPGLWGLRTEPRFAIGQEAHLVETPAGNVLWDCLSVVDDTAREMLRARGGLAAIALSHPHFYDSVVEWSHAFGGVPVHVHEHDREWVQRQDEVMRYWSGDKLEIVPGVDMVRCGGHFAGASVLHWSGGAEGRGVLLTSDIVQLVPASGWASFMYSYPNLLPLAPSAVRRIRDTLEELDYDRVYGSFYRAIDRDARSRIRASAERYLRALAGPDC